MELSLYLTAVNITINKQNIRYTTTNRVTFGQRFDDDKLKQMHAAEYIFWYFVYTQAIRPTNITINKQNTWYTLYDHKQGNFWATFWWEQAETDACGRMHILIFCVHAGNTPNQVLAHNLVIESEHRRPPELSGYLPADQARSRTLLEHRKRNIITC